MPSNPVHTIPRRASFITHAHTSDFFPPDHRTRGIVAPRKQLSPRAFVVHIKSAELILASWSIYLIASHRIPGGSNCGHRKKCYGTAPGWTSRIIVLPWWHHPTEATFTPLEVTRQFTAARPVQWRVYSTAGQHSSRLTA